MTDDTQIAPGNLQGSGTIDDAAARFERYLSAEDGKQKRSQSETAEKPTEEVEAQAETPEEGAETEADETTSEADEAEGDEAENSTDAPEDEAEGQDEADQVYTVKVDGKEIQVPLDELLKGYSRTADYSRKTEALARERDAFRDEAAKVKEKEAQYSVLLPALAQQLQSAMPQPPQAELLDTDPLQYFREKEVYEASVGKLNAAFSEMQRLQQEQGEEQLKQVKANIATAREKLPELVPAWKDPKAFERDRPKLRDYLKKVGYSDEEIDQAYDPRAVANAWKAMRYDEIVSRKPRPDTPLERVIRPTPSVVAPAAKSGRVGQEARKRLAQTGRIDDAAAAIRSLL